VKLAEAYRAKGDDEAGRLELRAARSAFERLGATLAFKRTEPPSEPLSATLAASAAPASADLGDLPTVGDVVDGKIELLRLLGGGGMGMVFEALHRRTGRHVAVKLLRRDLSTDPTACDRLLQEALACGRIQHPNVVDVYDAGVHGKNPYIVMELLRGESLGARIDRERVIAVDDAVRVIVQALAGLSAAHRAGIVHRDLKPDNLFLANPSTGDVPVVKVVDFGISKLTDREGALSTTQTGAIVGTPYYMSPEQAMGSKQLDKRTDIYSVGAVLFHLLTGRPPFVAENYNALLHAILTKPPPRPRSLRPEIPTSIEGATLRALAFDPDTRYATADEFAADLRGALS
jgi:serine/threonine-protein kinase